MIIARDIGAARRPLYAYDQLKCTQDSRMHFSTSDP